MIYAIDNELFFPPVELSEPDGLLCIGGDLSPERLQLAYRSGIFPWHDDPPMWFAPEKRMVVDLIQWQPSKTLKRLIKKGTLQCTVDKAFYKVIEQCSMNHGPTWISQEFITNYSELYQRGIAHSVEVWLDDQLVGGLYGLSIGSAFFGESMFHKVSNASKVAFAFLVDTLREKEIRLLDCQIHNDHLASLGAFEIPRNTYMQQLAYALEDDTQFGPWS